MPSLIAEDDFESAPAGYDLKPGDALLHCNGQDIMRKGGNSTSKSKNRVMVLLPFHLALPTSHDDVWIGSLRNLNSQAPELDIKTRHGTIRLTGRYEFPSNSFISITCQPSSKKADRHSSLTDVFDRILVFHKHELLPSDEDRSSSKDDDISEIQQQQINSAFALTRNVSVITDNSFTQSSSIPHSQSQPQSESQSQSLQHETAAVSTAAAAAAVGGEGEMSRSQTLVTINTTTSAAAVDRGKKLAYRFGMSSLADPVKRSTLAKLESNDAVGSNSAISSVNKSISSDNKFATLKGSNSRSRNSSSSSSSSSKQANSSSSAKRGRRNSDDSSDDDVEDDSSNNNAANSDGSDSEFEFCSFSSAAAGDATGTAVTRRTSIARTATRKPVRYTDAASDNDDEEEDESDEEEEDEEESEGEESGDYGSDEQPAVKKGTGSNKQRTKQPAAATTAAEKKATASRTSKLKPKAKPSRTTKSKQSTAQSSEQSSDESSAAAEEDSEPDVSDNDSDYTEQSGKNARKRPRKSSSNHVRKRPSTATKSSASKTKGIIIEID